jgi:sulfate adenylyltransferase
MAQATEAVAGRVDGLQAPHGGHLVNLQTPKDQWDAVIKSANKTMEASDRNACDVELLAVGGFSPLTGFMSRADYDGVVQDMRLENGLLFGIPVVLDTNRDDIVVGDKVLVTYQGQNIAVVTIEHKWTPNKPVECLNVYGTTSLEHPAVQMVAMERGKYYMGGKVQGLELPTRVFPCASPAEVRASLPKDTDVLAFQCRNPIHRAHYELFIRALEAPNVGSNSVCLVHPTCGPTQDDDIPGVVRFHTYQVLEKEVANPRLRWAYLPYSMHMAGPREAIQHIIIRKNYGCTHFIIGRDMAGCKSSITGEDFYGAYDAQELATKNAPELHMQTVPSLNIAYTKEQGYVTADIAEKNNLTKLNLSGTKFRQMLRGGEDIPEWFAFKSVVQVLREQILAEAN